MQHSITRTSVEWAEDVAEMLRIETDRGTLTPLWRRPLDEAMLSLFGEPRLPIDVWAHIDWYGPIEEWRRPEQGVSDILFNGPAADPFFIVQRGAMTNSGSVVHSSWIWFVQRQLLLRSRRLDATGDGAWNGPYAQGVADKMRYAITAQPFSRDGGSLAIRLLPERWHTLDDLIQHGAITPDAVMVLQAALASGASVMISGRPAAARPRLRQASPRSSASGSAWSSSRTAVSYPARPTACTWRSAARATSSTQTGSRALPAREDARLAAPAGPTTGVAGWRGQPAPPLFARRGSRPSG